MVSLNKPIRGTAFTSNPQISTTFVGITLRLLGTSGRVSSFSWSDGQHEDRGQHLFGDLMIFSPANTQRPPQFRSDLALPPDCEE